MRTPAQERFRSGYERGSVASKMPLARRREFYAWLKARNLDSHTYERQLEGKAPRRVISEV